MCETVSSWVLQLKPTAQIDKMQYIKNIITMNDEDEDDSVDNVSEDAYADNLEHASEPQILAWRRLINIVKANSVLYQKKLKGYSKQSDKTLMWNNIGASLIPPITGIAAEKEFYRLRQKFGKERCKVMQSQARSGAGADHVPYKSSWILYDDLMFLADHIQPRRTTSNYQRPVSMKVPASQISQLVTSTPLIYKSTCTVPQISDETQDVRNIKLYESLAGSSISTTEEERSCSTPNSVTSCSSVSFTSIKPSTTPDNISANIQKNMASAIIPQKQTPMADTVKKRKRGSTDEVDALIIRSSESISSLSNTLEAALRTLTQATSQLNKNEWTPAIQGMMGSIAVGLSKVPEESYMECLILILSDIHKFIKK